MRIPDNLDIFEMHEREQARLERRREAMERLEEENREERDNEKRTAGKN